MILSRNSLKKPSKEPGDIISSLLKKILGERLNKLEQKNKSDENIIISIKDATNKMEKILNASMKKSKYFLI